MFGNFLGQKPQGEQPQTEQPQTQGQTQGQIEPTGSEKFANLKLSGARRLSQVAGDNLTVINLRDHEEMDGQTVALVSRGQMKNGDYGDYILFPVILLEGSDDDGYKPVGNALIMTGSSNVIERVRASGSSMENPVIATFRMGGRAWFLD